MFCWLWREENLSAQVSINQITTTIIFISDDRQNAPVVDGAEEKERRNPADWKHLGDCREHSHIMQRWLRFDGALWSDSFDLSQRACVQLPGTTLAGKEDRARRSRHWMVPPLLMGTLLTANISFGLKCNQLVDAFGTERRGRTRAFQKRFGAHGWDECHNASSLWLAAACALFK